MSGKGNPVTARSQNARLQDRAERVIPGGMYGHNVQRFLWPGAPQFWDRGIGSRIWDVDGNEYVDLMCSWGPIIHGHRHPLIEEAFARQLAKLDTGNGPGHVFVDLAELLVATVSHADWAIFAKNGGDVTTLSLTVSRAATGRSTVLAAEGAYHGSHPWCHPHKPGVTAGDRAHLVYFAYNDLSSVRRLIAEHEGDVAGIIVSPFKHDAGSEQEEPTNEFARGLRIICDEIGAVLILDEVRAGFRMAYGSSWGPLGVEPDLSCWSKALGNGHPISALLGIDELRPAATSVFKGGTFWTSAAPMAAAIASIQLLRDQNGVDRMFATGDEIRQGLASQASSHGLHINISGPSTMPYLSFVGDVGWEKAKMWAAGAAARGLYVNPSHNWFISTALTERDVLRALEAMDGAFDDIVAAYGAD